MLFSGRITKRMNASYRERRGLDTPTGKLQRYAFTFKDTTQNFHRCVKPSPSVYCCLTRPPASVSELHDSSRTRTTFSTDSLGIKVGVNTYPCPIFSYLVYFFLGSPMLTIVPKKNQKRKTFPHKILEKS